jgi:ATP-dependent DNA ligase
MHPGPPATFVAFDLLELVGQSLIDRPWTERRQLLTTLDSTGSGGVETMVCDDGEALLAATAALGLEGVVAKKRNAGYVCGRRSRAWLKVKHRAAGWFDVAGWRPPSRSRPGAIVLAQDGHHVGTATGAMSATDSTALHRFIIERFGVPDGRRVRLPPGAQYGSSTPNGRCGGFSGKPSPENCAPRHADSRALHRRHRGR